MLDDMTKPEPMPGPFPIIEIDGKTHREHEIGEAANMGDAIVGLAQIAMSWEASKKGRSFKRLDHFTISLFYSDGKPRSTILAEMVPIKGTTHIADILVERKPAK